MTGDRLFDDRGNPMSPSHATKKGVRYRYYVSQAVLQGRKTEAGRIARVSAPDVERAICDGLRSALGLAADVVVEEHRTGTDVVGHVLGEQNVPGVSTIHYSLREVDPRAGHVQLFVQVAHFIDRSAMDPHAQPQLRLFF